jgi:hypothetical protein
MGIEDETKLMKVTLPPKLTYLIFFQDNSLLSTGPAQSKGKQAYSSGPQILEGLKLLFFSNS